MQEPFYVRKVAVLGAGVMGAQIAAHCVNAGFETLLYDLPAEGPKKNAIVEKAILNLTRLKPAPLATAQTAWLLQAKNYDDNLEELRGCDLVIEAIAERLDWKEALYKKIAPFLHEKALLVSNTSGLSINELSEVLPQSIQTRFCGVHFFNPPRYMALAEVIPARNTPEHTVALLETWLTRFLGKNVVIAKDTPNFIANRIGVFSLLITLHHAEKLEIGLDEVDALTGPLIGRPKSATCRTMDVVGLDTMAHVVRTMQQHLKNDPWYALFKLPNWLEGLIEQGALGQKSGQGIYRKSGKNILVFDAALKDYRESSVKVSTELQSILKIASPEERMQALWQSHDRQARFLAQCYGDLFHYSAFHLQDIADTTRDVDLAMRWGFGWRQGPFETWQEAGFETVKAALEKEISEGNLTARVPLPKWLQKTGFYSSQGAFSPAAETMKPRKDLAVYRRQIYHDYLPFEHPPTMPLLYENEGVGLNHFQQDVGILSFKTKGATINQAVLDGMQEALLRAERQCQGLIIYQHDPANFSLGADLRSVSAWLQANKMDPLEKMIAEFQQIVMQLKYLPIPSVAALRGRALGGGCELMMHCSTIVAAFESYPGLVEMGPGLLPAGGGCKEMALRAAHEAKNADIMSFLQPYFQQIAMASVAENASDAQIKGYLRASDSWLMSTNEVLFAAYNKILSLQAGNYRPPLQQPFKAAGRDGYARLRAGLINWREGGFISEHDYFIADKVAYVLCGGNVDQGTLIDEQWMLKLEIDAFMELAATAASQARIIHLLETGKPLRN